MTHTIIETCNKYIKGDWEGTPKSSNLTYMSKHKMFILPVILIVSHYVFAGHVSCKITFSDKHLAQEETTLTVPQAWTTT